MTDFRQIYGLPERYFLSLGRMVPKKNLSMLVSAYARYCQKADGRDEPLARPDHKQADARAARPYPVALVLVGSGEEEAALEAHARALGLEVGDHRSAGVSDSRHSPLVTRQEENRGAVFFYGFRQIEENPVFYALAEAFILPSLYEEWGLVVNEAMASSLPVIVSRAAGCAEDLLPACRQVTSADTENCKLNTENSLELRSNGFVFDPTSVEALSEALKRLASSEERKAMGQSSREIIGRWGCDNFARQALRAAQTAS